MSFGADSRHRRAADCGLRPPEVPLAQAGQAARASGSGAGAAIGDGASLCGIGWTGFGAGCTRGWTLAFATGFGGTGLGGVGVDSTATGAATGAGSALDQLRRDRPHFNRPRQRIVPHRHEDRQQNRMKRDDGDPRRRHATIDAARRFRREAGGFESRKLHGINCDPR